MCKIVAASTFQAIMVLDSHIPFQVKVATMVNCLLFLIAPQCWADDNLGDAAWKNVVLPLLQKHCRDCHGHEEPESRLTLTTRDGVFMGGISGPVITPGNAKASQLLQVLNEGADPHMPPEGQLPDREIAAIGDWIDKLPATTLAGRRPITPHDRSHWAFQTLRAPKLPHVQDAKWSNSAIDRFVLAKLEAVKMSPSSRVSQEMLLRRVYFDLIGLPPNAEQQRQFLADNSPDAYERVVDRLLASPRYGERWGRHWLDLARYADSGGFHNDFDRPHAWRYRDYVIDSFNEDKPYSQFVTEQIAGDQVALPTVASWVATAFCRNGPSNEDNMGTGVFKQQYLFDQLDDIVSTTGSVFLGLTVGCARCHDHKHDPLTQHDYYSFLAFFRNTSKQNLAIDSFDPANPKLTRSPRAKSKDGRKPIATVRSSVGNPSLPTHVLWRGDVRNVGPEVKPGVPNVLSRDSLNRTDSVANDESVTGPSVVTRIDLANWIIDRRNPLTWRVIANRLWHYHFGRGLVATPSNFGLLGDPATHPELLDYLASRLQHHGNSLKSLHREIVVSSTYCQSSASDPTKHQQDPGNLFLWRMSKRRLDAEPLRDAILMVAGNLNTSMGGPGIKPRIRPDLLDASQRNKWPAIKQETGKHWRRSVYIYVKRQLRFPMMEMFGSPSTSHSCARREHSLVPTQSLVLMNDEFVAEQAEHFARRVVSQAGADREAQVAWAMRIALGRGPPDESRITQAVVFLESQRQRMIDEGSSPDAATDKALADFCRVLINLSEFVYVD
jgi:hypothetical protein